MTLANIQTQPATYVQLKSISDSIIKTQESLNRGLAYASGGVPKAIERTKKYALQLVGKSYFIPDLSETMQLQREHIHSFLVCLGGILKTTHTELKGVENYSHSLLAELSQTTKQLSPNTQAQSNAAYRINVAVSSSPSLAISASSSITLNDITQYKTQLHQRRNAIKTQCLVGLSKLKGQYLKQEFEHAVAIEELLLDSLFTTGKMQLEAQSYYKLLTQLVHSYSTLGLNTYRLNEIQNALSSMQMFTNGIQSQIGNAIVSLQRATLAPSSLENRLRTTANSVNENRTQFLSDVHNP
jgi:hypothetical protein